MQTPKFRSHNLTVTAFVIASPSFLPHSMYTRRKSFLAWKVSVPDWHGLSNTSPIESTPLSCSLADQGIKIRIRKDIRVRKRPIQGLDHPLGPAGGGSAFGPGGPLGSVAGGGPIQPLGPVEGINESTPYTPGGGIPPPPGATLTSPPPVNIPPPPGATMSIPPGATNASENSVQLPIPQPNPHGGLSLPGVDRRSLPMPSAPGIGQGVVIEEEDERPMPSAENTRHRINPLRRASNANDLDDDENEYEDQMEEDDEDDDEYREDGIVQTHLGRRNPSTRHKRTTPKRREIERRVNKTKHKTAVEEDAMMVDDDLPLDQDSSGRRGNSTVSRKGGKDKGSKGREVKRQRTAEEHANADAEGASETGQEEIPAQNQALAHPASQPPVQRHYAYLPPPPHLVWGHPPAMDPALQPSTSAPPQNGTSMNAEATNGSGMIYDPRYQQQYYDTQQQQPTQPYQPQGPPPPSAGQYMTAGYPPLPPGQYAYSLGHPPPPGQYPQQYYQPGVQTWGPPPPSISYPPQVPVYAHPPPTTNDPYANYPAPPQQQPQQQFQPRYDYGPHPHHHPSMYGPPPPGPHPMQPYYYDQAPSHVPPPQQYATASPTPPTSGNATTSTAEGTPRTEYSNNSANTSTPAGQRSASPVPVSRYSGVQQPPVSHPPPPSHHIGPPHHYYQPIPPQHYPGPYNLYGVYTANSSTLGASNVGDPWVNPPASSTNWPGNANGDAYPAGTQSQQQTFNQQVVIQSRSQQMSQTHSQPHHGQDRIQLAPLRVAGSMTTSSPTTASSAASGGISPTVSSSASHRSAGSDPYPVIRMKSTSQPTVGYAGPSSGQDHDERDRDMDRGRRDDRGKRNPLSIGSIISDETT